MQLGLSCCVVDLRNLNVSILYATHDFSISIRTGLVLCLALEATLSEMFESLFTKSFVFRSLTVVWREKPKPYRASDAV